MRLPNLALVVSAGGCSFVYNPDKIPSGVDAEMITDVNPTLLHVDSLGPAQLWEGEGDGMSRPCVLAIAGGQIQDAIVTIAPATPNPAVTIVIGQQMVAPDHDWIGVEVTAKVMDTVDEATGDVPLTVTVTQPGADPTTLPWVLKPLDQLTTTQFSSAMLDTASLKPRYSMANVSGDVTFTGTSRAVVVAMSSITFDGAITASAPGKIAGPGGCDGGGIGSKGGCGGGGGGGGTGGGGGGAGFSIAGNAGAGTNVGTAGTPTGDLQISTYAGHPAGDNTANAASGGGGGAQGIAGSGTGGGGGGTVELTAGGDLTLAAIAVDGHKGADGGGVGGCGGGGGAGGVIVVRSGHAITMHGALSSAGGAGGGGGVGAAGGAGVPGRIRYDAATMPALPTSTVPPHRGISFVAPPTITTNPHLVFSLVGAANDAYAFVIHDQVGAQQQSMTGHAIGTDGTDTFMSTLTPGNNEICVIAGIGTYSEPEAKTCVHVAFLPGGN